jgi:hypothetical protein
LEFRWDYWGDTLKELLRLQQERLFGKKSEASKSILDPLTSAANNTQSTESIPEPKTTVITSHVRHIPPRGNRQLNLNNLPKYTVTYDLSDSEKNCSHCGGHCTLLIEKNLSN